MAYLPVKITPANPPRGAGTTDPTPFFAQAITATFAWGSNPGSATIVYIGDAPVTAGALIKIEAGNHLFYGLCISDTVKDGSDGKTRTLEFRDLREMLQWDNVFGAFNKVEVRTVNGGARLKRYWHIYPNNYNSWIKTYSAAPLKAYEIFFALMAGGTIGSPWSWNTANASGYLDVPIYEFDALGGKRLDAALAELSERSGVVFTLISDGAGALTPNAHVNVAGTFSAYQLVWTRKGFPANTIPSFPTNSDQRRTGFALSGHPTNLRIVGDRNLYQVMEVAMVKDWAPAWEQFVTVDRFAEDIFLRASNQRTGQRFNAYPGDAQQYSGRQDAYARALEITVREYVLLRNDTSFADTRMYAGRCRMDIPCATYINTILYRAFRPAGTELSLPGRTVPLDSLDIADHLLCKVTHNAAAAENATNVMGYDASAPIDGNGYAIVFGYQVGADLFKTLNSDQFNINMFSGGTAVWQHVPFQIDDSGEGVRFIIFDEPVIVSNNLLVNTNGHTVINANFALTVPSVRCALVFEAERYSWWQGTYPNVSRDAVENVSGLHREMVGSFGVFNEIPYANGALADNKAVEIANFLLQRQYVYAEGGYKVVWDPNQPASGFGTALSSLIDRVQFVSSPTAGIYELVDFTNERARDNFEPERELDRKTQQGGLVPGQQELREEAEQHRKLAAAFRQNPKFVSTFEQMLNGTLGSTQPLQIVYVPLATGTWPVGSILRKSATITTPTLGDGVTGSDNIFVGVTTRENEDLSKPTKIQHTGRGLARVKGPVSVNDALGLSDGPGTDNGNYLVKDGDPACAKALQEITDTNIKLIAVNFGVGGGGASTDIEAFEFISEQGDTIHGKRFPDDGSGTIVIAKPYKLRWSITQKVVGNTIITYTYDGPTRVRTAHNATTGETEQQGIIPGFLPARTIASVSYPADIIYAIKPPSGMVLPNDGTTPSAFLDINADGRAWARQVVQSS